MICTNPLGTAGTCPRQEESMVHLCHSFSVFPQCFQAMLTMLVSDPSQDTNQIGSLHTLLLKQSNMSLDIHICETKIDKVHHWMTRPHCWSLTDDFQIRWDAVGCICNSPHLPSLQDSLSAHWRPHAPQFLAIWHEHNSVSSCACRLPIGSATQVGV
jgi:hypothetical protein